MEIIVILLLLMPGLVTMRIDQVLSATSKSSGTDYEWVFKALAFNIPALTLTWCLLWLINKGFIFLGLAGSWDLSSLTTLSIRLKSLKFVLLYLVISLVVGIVVGYFIAKQRNEGTAVYRFLNWLRESQGKSNLLGAPSPWDKCLNNRNEPVVEIIKSDGTSIKGFLRDFSLGDEPKELTIDCMDVAEKWHEYLDTVISVYYHLDSGTLIKIYDKTEYITTLKEMGKL